MNLVLILFGFANQRELQIGNPVPEGYNTGVVAFQVGSLASESVKYGYESYRTQAQG
jgi:hypothetical protein